jgi:hypothetical protein
MITSAYVAGCSSIGIYTYARTSCDIYYSIYYTYRIRPGSPYIDFNTCSLRESYRERMLTLELIPVSLLRMLRLHCSSETFPALLEPRIMLGSGFHESRRAVLFRLREVRALARGTGGPHPRNRFLYARTGRMHSALMLLQLLQPKHSAIGSSVIPTDSCSLRGEKKKIPRARRRAGGGEHNAPKAGLGPRCKSRNSRAPRAPPPPLPPGRPLRVLLVPGRDCLCY